MYRLDRPKWQLNATDFGRIIQQHEGMHQLCESLSLEKHLERHVYLRDTIDLFEAETGHTVTMDEKDCMHETHTFLRARPEGRLENGDLIAFDCKWGANHTTIRPGVQFPYLGENGTSLREEAEMYYQLQGQMACCNVRFCHLALLTMYDFKSIVIERDSHFFGWNMFPALRAFYDNIYVPYCNTQKKNV